MIEPIEFLIGNVVPKAWGHEYHIVNNDFYCLKKLVFLPGKKMSGHSHDEKSETWHIEKGRFVMTYFDLNNADVLTRELKSGDIVHIPRGNPHQLEAVEKVDDSVVLEVSTKDRPEDNYRIIKGDSQLSLPILS